MLLVTGGAGFIGSNVVAALNDAGRSDVAVCDLLGHDGKWRNLAKRQLADILPPSELPAWLNGRRLDAVIHLGAISETTATDGDLVIETNFRLSMRLLDWCTVHATPFIYASSAATYGDGAQGFADDAQLAALKTLRPMNLYGWSKHLFDMAVAERAARGERLPPQWAGLKFFNVFGPNEYHKGAMMSVLAQRFDDVKAGRTGATVQVASRRHRGRRPAARFHLCRRRGAGDDVAVGDAVGQRPVQCRHRQGAQLQGSDAGGLCRARARPNIEYIDMPESIRDSYQYFTQSEVDRLQRAGYNGGFTALEDSVGSLRQGFLDRPDRFR